MDYAVQIRGLNKTFGAVQALKDIDIDIYRGETVAFAGENGAGKSTLMKILTGVYPGDCGEISINNKKESIKNTLEAKKLGISQVYQRSELALELSIAENIFLGEDEYANRGLINWTKLYKKTNELLEEYNFTWVDAKMPMKYLSVADRHLVSIIKVIQRDPDIIIFDEPTAVLSESEVDTLFAIIERLKEEHKTILYISHRLEEIFKVSDRIYVMKDGEIVAQFENEWLTTDDIITKMLGRKLDAIYPEKVHSIDQKDAVPVLEVKNLTTKHVTDISFNLYKGEILGLAGLVGSGRTELSKALYGLDKKISGSVSIDGEEVKIMNPTDAIKIGLFMTPEDRKGEGLVLPRPIRENVIMPNMNKFTRWGVVNRKQERSETQALKERLSIKAPSVDTLCDELSGGNQQKVVVAKALMVNPKVLIMDEPTQGVDVGSKHEIYSIITNLASKEGKAVLFISSELEEIKGLCSRVIVMNGGRLTGEVCGEDVEDIEKILSLMYKVVKGDEDE